jgi:hypothetical protein
MEQTKHFAICVRNEGYEGTLEVRKLYEVLQDASAEQRSFIRVVDESGEDYLYPKSWFVAVDLPRSVEEQLIDLSSR